jgi:hypothetical protein
VWSDGEFYAILVFREFGFRYDGISLLKEEKSAAETAKFPRPINRTKINYCPPFYLILVFSIFVVFV